MTILIVDDDPDIRMLANIILTDAGYSTREASDGLEALEIQKKAPAQIWLLDVFMPNCDGLEAIKRAKKLYPALPIICMSSAAAESQNDYTAIGLRFGANVALPKPFEPESLLAAVAQAEDILNGRQ